MAEVGVAEDSWVPEVLMGSRGAVLSCASCPWLAAPLPAFSPLLSGVVTEVQAFVRHYF